MLAVRSVISALGRAEDWGEGPAVTWLTEEVLPVLAWVLGRERSAGGGDGADCLQGQSRPVSQNRLGVMPEAPEHSAPVTDQPDLLAVSADPDGVGEDQQETSPDTDLAASSGALAMATGRGLTTQATAIADRAANAAAAA